VDSDDLLVEPLMNLILELRQSARQRKDWETADQIRNQLAELSIELKDSKSGTTWQRQ
jgi:cysteinyl-tRNA synthetase